MEIAATMEPLSFAIYFKNTEGEEMLNQ